MGRDCRWILILIIHPSSPPPERREQIKNPLETSLIVYPPKVKPTNKEQWADKENSSLCFQVLTQRLSKPNRTHVICHVFVTSFLIPSRRPWQYQCHGRFKMISPLLKIEKLGMQRNPFLPATKKIKTEACHT